jgi:hypothetical protein
MHVEVTVGQESVPQGSKNAGLSRAEVVRKDQVERSAGFGLVVVVPAGSVPTSALRHLLTRQTKEEQVPSLGSEVLSGCR